MNLSKKYSISFGVTLAIFLLVLAWVTQTVMLQGFTNIEENLVKDDVNRVIKILEGELSNLDSTNVDWSTWDDTFGFVNGSIPDYPETNLQDSAIANIRVNMMLFLNSSGDVIYTKGVDLTEKTDMQVPAEMINAVRSNSRLSRHYAPNSKTASFMLLPEGPVLVSSRPILQSSGKGPVGGALVLARYLSASEISRLQSQTQVPFTLSGMRESETAEFLKFAGYREGLDEETYVKVISDDKISGYTVLKGLDGAPILLLRVDEPRTVYNQGKTSLYYMLLSFLILGVIFMFLAKFFTDKLILSRLSILELKVGEIAASGDFSMRVAVSGDDELSALEARINKMLESRQESANKRNEMSEELKKHIEELEKFNKLSVGRELQMMTLKKRIEELEGQLKGSGN